MEGGGVDHVRTRLEKQQRDCVYKVIFQRLLRDSGHYYK